MRVQKQSESMLASLLQRPAPLWQEGQVAKQDRRKQRRGQGGNAPARDGLDAPPHAHYMTGVAYAAGPAAVGGGGVSRITDRPEAPGHDRQQVSGADEGDAAPDGGCAIDAGQKEPVSLSNMTGKGARVVRSAVV